MYVYKVDLKSFTTKPSKTFGKMVLYVFQKNHYIGRNVHVAMLLAILFEVLKDQWAIFKHFMII